MGIDRTRENAASSPGHTSILAAVGRGIHLELGRPPLLADSYAMDLAGGAGASLLATLRERTTPEGLATFGRAFAIRARLVEDEVELVASKGVTQYLILGAGLDSYALRRPVATRRVRIFEADRPAAQTWKRERLAQLKIAEPDETVYVPVDFELGGLTDALRNAGFDFSAPTVVSWIAVVQYLAAEAIDATLKVIAGLPSGSRLVMSYCVPPAELTELERAGLDWTRTQAESRGEPFLTLLTPVQADAMLRGHKFVAVTDYGPDQLRTRYFRGQPDLSLPGIERIAVASL